MHDSRSLLLILIVGMIASTVPLSSVYIITSLQSPTRSALESAVKTTSTLTYTVTSFVTTRPSSRKVIDTEAIPTNLRSSLSFTDSVSR